MVKTGQVNFGIGLEAAANKEDLFFNPLLMERFDLTVLWESTQILAMLLDHYQFSRCCKAMAGLSVHVTIHTGE